MRIYILICFFVFFQLYAVAQSKSFNSCTTSLSFAQFLATEGSFRQAQRVLWELPDSCQTDSTILQQIELCRKLFDYKQLISIAPSLISKMKSDSAKQKVFIQYAIAKYSSGQIVPEQELLAARFLPVNSLILLQQSNCMLGFGKTSFCSVQLQQEWVESKKNIHFKSPAKAAMLSVLLPGAGKAYCGLKQDAFYSFISVALSSFQAYRGFNERGTKSIYGWFSAAFAFSFYSGSIYGSAKSAKKYNQKKIDAFRQEYIKKTFRY